MIHRIFVIIPKNDVNDRGKLMISLDVTIIDSILDELFSILRNYYFLKTNNLIVPYFLPFKFYDFNCNVISSIFRLNLTEY